MTTHLRNRHFFLLDIILVFLASYFSYVLRLEQFNLHIFWPSFIVFAPTAVVIVTVVFRWQGIYARFWRYASVNELMLLLGAVTLATVIASATSYVTILALPIEINIPRSIPFIFLLLAIGATAGPRLMVRLSNRPRPLAKGATFKRVLIVGAGDAGSLIVRELQRNAQLGIIPVGFVDDDPSKLGVKIHGILVMGNRRTLPQLITKYGIEQVIIAIPTAPGKVIREIVQSCEKLRVPTKTMPGVYELLSGQVSVNQLRDVQIEDLLRRQPIEIDTEAVQSLLRGKTVLVTGGGGSIGSELCRQIMRCQPAHLVVVGHGENSIFDIYHEMSRLSRQGAQTSAISAVIADVRFADRIDMVFQEYRPNIVFHAAAHKHVPLMELNPAEAVTNNVQGTQNVINAALDADVDQFVMISTDKAVNPTSIMGASKRVAELLVHKAAQKSGKPFVAVRFGNVLGSRGSVVLTFQRQIAAGGPVTVTDPEMSRFFMTIPEAVQLVLQASVLGSGGEVFVLDMGDPVKIVDLARDLIELSGLEVGRDIDIVFTGPRPGEKLYEELFVPGEVYNRTRHAKLFIASNASSFIPKNLETSLSTLLDAAAKDDRAAIVHAFEQLIAEFAPIVPQLNNSVSQEVIASSAKVVIDEPAPLSTAKIWNTAH
ncbi:MAG: polysaccharide biosynthesis protein [Anaerolineae bacterium]|nr:polysaccharide biosynthesis protein [Anaerolineae bacterium]